MRKPTFRYLDLHTVLKAYLCLNMEIKVQKTDKECDDSFTFPGENYNIFSFLNYTVIFESIIVKIKTLRKLLKI